ncbi:MAG: hypothetical protein RSG96_04260, partial [Clostridia bacterium]
PGMCSEVRRAARFSISCMGLSNVRCIPFRVLPASNAASAAFESIAKKRICCKSVRRLYHADQPSHSVEADASPSFSARCRTL